MSEKEYYQFRHDCKAAIEFLTANGDGIAVAALHHPLLGDVDLVWDNEGDKRKKGYGLAKIIKYHPEVLNGIQEILNRTVIVKYKGEKGFDVYDNKKNYVATIRIRYNGENRNWLMTMFKKDKAPK